ncbi:hypothetical protein FS837_006088, partial [Tulasnella sp. UAMH 9824]
ISREETRFNTIRDSLPAHLRPGDVPDPMRNLSTAENEHFICLYKLAEQVQPPSDAVSNALFIDAMTKILGENKAEYFSHNVIRLSEDRKYGYIAGVQPFKQSSTIRPLPFALFTLSSAADGRCLHGKYMWYDIPLLPLTENDHQCRRMPGAIISSHPGGQIPCAAIVFHSFEDDLRNIVQTASSVPESQNEVMSQAYSKVAESVTYQYGCRQEDIEAILEQVGASRQGRDRIFAPAERAERVEREVTNHHWPTSPTSTVNGQPSLPSRDIVTQEKANTPKKPVSRKGKEKASYFEEERSEASDVAKEPDAEAAVQVHYDHSYASQLAIIEAKRNGVTQELLESLARNGVSRAMTQARLEDETSLHPGRFGTYPVWHSHRGRRRSPFKFELYPSSRTKLECGNAPPSIPRKSDDGLATASLGDSATAPNQDTDSGDRSTQALDTSTAKNEQRPNIPNGGGIDDGTSVIDEERRNGDGVMGINGPATPARGPGEKRKRTTTPSTGDSDRPAPKHQRPGSEIDDLSSPLSQRLDRGLRNESASNPVPRPSHESKGQSKSGQMGLPRPPARLLRGENFTPIEEEGSGYEGVSPNPRVESGSSAGLPKPRSSDVPAEAKEREENFETLEEVGIRVTSPRASSQQPFEIGQIAEEAPRQDLSGPENDHALLLAVLETSYGVLSTVDPELLATVGLRLMRRQPRVMAHPTRLPTDRAEAASNEVGCGSLLETWK